MEALGTKPSDQQIQTLTANGNTIQYVTDGDPEQAAVAVLQAVFGNSTSLISNSKNESNMQVTGSESSVLKFPSPISNGKYGHHGSSFYEEIVSSDAVTSSLTSSNISHVTSLATTESSGVPTQIVAQSGNTFLVQSNNIDSEAAPITHTTRASPITVQWLLDNYETAEGVSLPRCALYYHYLKHCKENELEPVNAASFGKLIRSVFLGLKTRRLGTRGNSKYHYYGIRIKPGSPLNNVPLDFLYQPTHSKIGQSSDTRVNLTANREQLSRTYAAEDKRMQTGGDALSKNSITAGKGAANREPNHSRVEIGSSVNGSAEKADAARSSNVATVAGSAGSFSGDQLSRSAGESDKLPSASTPSAGLMKQYRQYLGEMSFPGSNTADNLPFADFDDSCLPEGVLSADLSLFQNLYISHCEAIKRAVSEMLLGEVESYWMSFWKRVSTAKSVVSVNSGKVEDGPWDVSWRHEGTFSNSASALDANGLDLRLSKPKLINLSKCEVVWDFVKRADELLYQTLVDFLVVNVLRPIPSPLTQAIRNFAKNLEAKMKEALGSDYCVGLIDAKLSRLNAFSQMLRRYTSLNHLAQAARAVLQNSAQITQMLADLNRVDFQNVQDQARWVCDCDEALIGEIESDFKQSLQMERTLEQWARWLEGVVEKVLHESRSDCNVGEQQHRNTVTRQRIPEEVVRFTNKARRFLLHWSFYSSMVIRDLTLRSAASFGSFHLIRLLYDEYMFYLVEHKVAKVQGKTAIAVIAQSKDNKAASATGQRISSIINDNAFSESEVGKDNDDARFSEGVLDASRLSNMNRSFNVSASNHQYSSASFDHDGHLKGSVGSLSASEATGQGLDLMGDDYSMASSLLSARTDVFYQRQQDKSSVHGQTARSIPSHSLLQSNITVTGAFGQSLGGTSGTMSRDSNAMLGSSFTRVIQHNPMQYQNSSLLQSAGAGGSNNVLMSSTVYEHDSSDLNEEFEDCESDTEDTIDMTRAEMSLAQHHFHDAIQGDVQYLLDHSNSDSMLNYDMTSLSGVSMAMTHSPPTLTTSNTHEGGFEGVGGDELVDVKPTGSVLFGN